MGKDRRGHRRGADHRLLVRSEVVHTDLVLPVRRLADHILLRTVTVGDVPRDISAPHRPVVAVEGLFTARFDHMQIDIGRVSIPREDDPDIDINRLLEPLVILRDNGLFALFPLLRVDPRHQRVHLLQREERDHVRMAVPRGQEALHEQTHRLFQIGLRPVLLAALHQRQGEIAVGLALLTAQLHDPAQKNDRAIIGLRLAQPPRVDPQHRRVLNLQLRQVREHPESRRPFACRQEELRRIEIKRGAARPPFPLLQITPVGILHRYRLHLLQVGRIRRPRLDLDRRRRGAVPTA